MSKLKIDNKFIKDIYDSNGVHYKKILDGTTREILWEKSEESSMQLFSKQKL